MADTSPPPIWWIELIKISPGLIGALIAAVLVLFNLDEIRRLLRSMTKFKGLGIEAEFAAGDLDAAIVDQQVQVSSGDRSSALKRLNAVAPLMRDARILWVDDNPISTKYERALLEKVGVRVTSVRSSVAAERELRENTYLLVLTDLDREGNPREGLDFLERTVLEGTGRWTIAYVGTDQFGLPRPPYLFAITNRPDHLIHYICDVVERERL